MNFTHNIEGGEELEKFLMQFPVKVEKKYLKIGLRGPVNKLKARIRAEIKAAYTMRTGTLLRGVKHTAQKARHGVGVVVEMRSIHNDTRRIKNSFKRRAKVKQLKAKKEEGRYNDAYYARFLIRGKRIKPNPFLDKALDAIEANAKVDFNQSLIKNFEREAAKMLLKR